MDNSSLDLKRFEAKTFVILGLGREGLSTYKFLRAYFRLNQIHLLDQKTPEELTPDWQKILDEDKNTTYSRLNTNDKSVIDHLLSTIIFKSPGISPHSDFYKQAIAQYPDAEITSNTNLFFELMKDTVRIIGVTGTKGKSTTTSAIYHVLKHGSEKFNKRNNNQNPKRVFHIAGNIGVPPLELIPEIEAELDLVEKYDKPIERVATVKRHPAYSLITVVLELSSHQLLNLKYSPNVAVIQEIVPEHLDYYKDFEEYVSAKAKIVASQVAGDEIIYNSKYLYSKNIAMNNKTEGIMRFDINVDQDSENTEHRVLAVNSGIISFNNEDIIDTKELQIKGTHNILNILPAIVIAKNYGLSNEDIRNALQTFKPLKHRLELVGTVNGVEYYNDSLATTPEACIAALSAFPDKQIILIAGGYDRHLDFKELATEILARSVKKLLLFKPTGELIAQELTLIQDPLRTNSGQASDEFQTSDISYRSSVIDYQYIETMQEAVKEAYDVGEPGDIVLMSPASASFGRFKDYADRGEQFEKAVDELSSKI